MSVLDKHHPDVFDPRSDCEQKYRTTVVVSSIPDSKYIAYMEKIEIFVKSLGLDVKVNIGEEDA